MIVSLLTINRDNVLTFTESEHDNFGPLLYLSIMS